MLIGIDHLARVNDAFGFDVADAVIAEIGKRIPARLRGGNVLGRFSGNKSGLMLRNCTVDDTSVAAGRFLAAIRDDVVPTKSGPVSVTASIGAVRRLRAEQIKTVTEWVKDEESAVMLREWGCDYIEGRLISLARPERPWSARADAMLPAAGQIFPHVVPAKRSASRDP
jgi:diguanylate cyclase (GGDEF)-like protein